MTYRTAENLGESGIKWGLVSLFVPCISAYFLREKARNKNNIAVSFLTNLFFSFLCKSSICRDHLVKTSFVLYAASPVSDVKLMLRSKINEKKAKKSQKMTIH